MRDFERLVTPGHVTGHRARVVLRQLIAPAAVTYGVGVVLGLTAIAGIDGGISPPRWFDHMLTADPANYVEKKPAAAPQPQASTPAPQQIAATPAPAAPAPQTLPDWMPDSIRTADGGLDWQSWQKLGEQVVADVGQYGLDTAAWSHISVSQVGGATTEAGAVFQQTPDMLRRGIIYTNPSNPASAVWLFAIVRGRLSALQIFQHDADFSGNAGCHAVVGIDPALCGSRHPLSLLDAFKPG